MINGIKPKVLKCSMCSNEMPSQRLDMGYTICVNCSTEEKVSCHTIYPHKTGGYIQVVSKQQSSNLNRLDRRCTSQKTAKHYKEYSIEPMEEPKQYKSRKCTKQYTSYEDALQMVNQYYEECQLWFLKKPQKIYLLHFLLLKHFVWKLLLDPIG